MPRTSKSYDQGFRDGFKKAMEEWDARQKQRVTDIDTYGLEEAAHRLTRNFGYIRMGFGTQGLFYVRYKWTREEHADTYTMGSNPSLGAAIANCMEHADEVEAGKRKATVDTPYRQPSKTRP